MPDSRQPPSDGGGQRPDRDLSRSLERHLAQSDDDRSGDATSRDRRGRYDDDWDDRGPNYLVRRAIAVGVGVALVAGGAVVASRFIDDDDGGSGASSGSANWNTIVAIDGITGSVVLTNDDGEETDRFRLGVQPLVESTIVGPSVVASTETELAVASLRDTSTVITVELERGGPLLMPSGSSQTVVAHDTSADRAVLVHGPTGEIIDTAMFDVITGARFDLPAARSDPSGRHVLVTDTGNFQSVLFSFDRDTPSFFPGLALAVDGDVVVTAQNVGTDATVAVFDHAGEPSVSARTKSVRAGMIVDGGVVLVTIEGDVLLMSLTDGSVDEAADLTTGIVESGDVAVTGNRLIVVGEDGTAVVDDSGAVIVDLPAARPTTSGIDRLAPRRSECLIVERAAVGEIVVVRLDDGSIVAEALAGPDVLAPANGCEPVVPTSAGYLVITADGVLRATIGGDVVALSPDGRTIVVDEANRHVLLPRVTEDDATAEAAPIDIGRSGRSALFADL